MKSIFMACATAALVVVLWTGAAPGSATEILHVKALKGTFERDGKLDLPDGVEGKVPVVLFMPGTDGIDQRLGFHRPGLLAAGIATLEIDTKTGIFTGEKDRPENAFFEPIAFGALKALQAHPRIDPARVGVLGWSAGATTSVSVAHVPVAAQFVKAGEFRFAAHVGLYGGCTSQRVQLTGVPILVLQGNLDTHVPYKRCVDFKANYPIVSFVLYPDVHHGFDKEGVNWSTGNRTMRWNKEAAEDARAKVLEFFVKQLKATPPPS